MLTKIAVVDGANIAYIEKSHKGDPKISNILAVRELLQKKGYDVELYKPKLEEHRVDS